MSCYYDLKCLDCAARAAQNPEQYKPGYAGFDANRGHRDLLAISALRPEYEALGLALQRFKTKAEEAGNVSWEGGLLLDAIPRAAYFYAGHVGHTVVVESEYGEAYFGCDQYVGDVRKNDCAPRENSRDCRLDRGHEGPHSRTRPDGR